MKTFGRSAGVLSTLRMVGGRGRGKDWWCFSSGEQVPRKREVKYTRKRANKRWFTWDRFGAHGNSKQSDFLLTDRKQNGSAGRRINEGMADGELKQCIVQSFPGKSHNCQTCNLQMNNLLTSVHVDSEMPQLIPYIV